MENIWKVLYKYLSLHHLEEVHILNPTIKVFIGTVLWETTVKQHNTNRVLIAYQVVDVGGHLRLIYCKTQHFLHVILRLH